MAKKTTTKTSFNTKTRYSNTHHSIARLSTKANIGDSLESRMDGLFLGGGSDLYQDIYGIQGYWGAQSDGLQIGGGLVGDKRLLNTSLSKNNLSVTKLAWHRIKICRAIYENDGQVASIIDLMADFATEGINFNHSSKSVEKFFLAWSDKVNIKDRFRRAIIDCLISGIEFYYKVYATLSDKDVTTLKSYSSGTVVNDDLVVTKSNGVEEIVAPSIKISANIKHLLDIHTDIKDKDNFVKSYIINKLKSSSASLKLSEKESAVAKEAPKTIPWKYISLNPVQMVPNDIGGWSYLLTKQDVSKLLSSLDITINDDKNEISVELPDGFKGKIKPITNKKADTSGFFAEIEVDPKRLVVITYNKFDWTKWPISMLWKVVPTVMFKNTLRSMELKTARSAINTVTLWKLGDHKEGLIPEPEHFERLSDMLKAPSSTINVIWDSAIEASVIQPKLDQILDTKRWEELRKEITAQFGITQSVITGEGGNFSSSYISVQGLLEKLNTLRELLLASWILPEVREISETMGFRKLPKVIFGTMSLRDEKAEKQLILNLLDRGYISDETAMEYIGRDIDTERRRIKEQTKFDDENDVKRRGPFIVPVEQQELALKQLKSQEKIATQKSTELSGKPGMTNKSKKPKKPNGRPPGTGRPQSKKRTPKPKNMASVDIASFITKCDALAKTALTELEGKKLYKELSKENKEKVIDIVAHYLSEQLFTDAEEPTVDGIKGFIAKGGLLNDDKVEFIESLKTILTNFKVKNIRKPNKLETYQMLSEAFLQTNLN